MLLLAVISTIFAVSTADPLACCMPRRWSGLLLEVGGSLEKNSTQGHVTDNYLFIHYDYDLGKQAVVSHERDEQTGKRHNTTVVYDYKNSRLHIVGDDGKCHTDPLDPHGQYDPCMLQSLEYGSSYTVGSSKKRFQVNTYQGMLGKQRFGMVVTADRNCYPVADKLYGMDDKGAAVYAFFFLNITTTHVNNAMFALPDACKPMVISPGVGKRDLDVLGIKRRPFSYE